MSLNNFIRFGAIAFLFVSFSFNSNEVNAQRLSDFLNDAAQEQSYATDEETSEETDKETGEDLTFAELMEDAAQEQSCTTDEETSEETNEETSEGLTLADFMNSLVVETNETSQVPFLTEEGARNNENLISETPATSHKDDAPISTFNVMQRCSSDSENIVLGVSGNNGTLWTLSLAANDQTIEILKQKAQNSEGESVKWYGPALKENVAYSENIYAFGQNAFRKDFVQELQSNNGYAFGVRNFNALVPRLNKVLFNETGIRDGVTPLSDPNGVSFLTISKIEESWTNHMEEYTIPTWNGKKRNIPGFSGIFRYTISKLENGTIVFHLKLKNNVWLSIVSARDLQNNGDIFSETICQSFTEGVELNSMEIALPAFKIESKIDLLSDPEIGEVFGNPSNCSLSFFEGGDDQFVTKLEQRNLFELSKDGLKAASVTTGETAPKCLHVATPEMIVDEAFFFIVSCYDEEDDILMPTFIGRCSDPSDSNEDASSKGVLK